MPVFHVFTTYCDVDVLYRQSTVPGRNPRRRSILQRSAYRPRNRMRWISHYTFHARAERFSSSHPASGTCARTCDQPIGPDRNRFSSPPPSRYRTSVVAKYSRYTAAAGTGAKDDNDNDITIACVLRWFRSYTEDQGTHTHVCRPARQVEEGGRDREEEVECGFGGRGAHALVHRPRTQSRYPRRTHMYARSLFLSLSFARTTYPTSLTRERNRESAEEHVYAPVCVDWSLVYGPVPVHSGTLSPSRESAFVFPVIHRAARCAYVREHVWESRVPTREETTPCRAAHTANPVVLGAPTASRPSRAPQHLASLTYDTIRASHKAGR